MAKRKFLFFIISALILGCGKSQDPFVKEMQAGVRYTYYSDGSCRPSSNQVCLTRELYKKICDSALGVTNGAISARGATGSQEEQTLLQGGKIENIKVLWSKGLIGEDRCFAVVTASGIVNGNSKRVDASGTVVSFIKNPKGEVLVESFSQWFN